MIRNKARIIFLIFLIISPFITAGALLLNNTNIILSDREINPSNQIPSIDLSELPQIDYEALNSSWYNPKIEMIIIAPEGNTEFVNALKPLSDWKNEKGVKTVILSNYSSYGGIDTPTTEKIRNMIKSFYESDGIRWVLLAGDAQEELIPIRYVYNPDTVDIANTETVGDNYVKPTDYYYADLTGDWDEDGDGKYGESRYYNANGVDEIDWIPEVYVGRLPANDATELINMVQKILKYEKEPNNGDWMNQMLLAGGISDTIAKEPPDGEDESRLTTYIWQNYVQQEMNFTHLWRSASYVPPDPKEPLTNSDFVSHFDSGYSTVIIASHGGPHIFSGMGGTIYTKDNALNSNNINMPSLIYGDACTTSSYDIESGIYQDSSIGEILINQSNRGAIGYVGALRVTWYYTNDYELEMLNRGNAKLFWKEFFVEKKFQQGRTLYDSKVTYMNTDYFKNNRLLPKHAEADRKNLLTYNLLGDPEVDIYTNRPSNVTNPFPLVIYEGQLVNVTIRDQLGRNTPYPRVYLKTDVGIERTVYGDENGTTLFRLPPGAGLKYNVSISGHNLIMSNFSFTTIADTEDPEIISTDLTPKNPTLSSKLIFTVNTQDNESGIEGVFILLSTNNFRNYFYYQYPCNYLQNESKFDCEMKYFNPGNYNYLYVIRDYLNHTDIVYESSFRFLIAIPPTYYLLIGAIIGILCITLISIYFVYTSIKKNSEHLARQ